MPERRSDPRPESPDRRSFPRPPLWLNLLLLVLGAAGLLFARYHRRSVEVRFHKVIEEEQRTPSDAKAMKDELAEMDLSNAALKKELEGRMKFVANLKSENFYLSIDTKAQTMRFHYGDAILREVPVTIGESKTIKSAGKSWTFMPLKGAFPIQAKVVDYAWPLPEWLYAMNGQPIPAQRASVPDALGKYVVFLPNGYVIHSPPPDSSPLKGAKPGSVMVSEQDLMAIWPRIHQGTAVYIY
jgi:hypothetical protein